MEETAGLPEQWLIGPHLSIQIIDIVEKAKVVVNLQDDGRYGHSESDKVDPLHILPNLGWEIRAPPNKERSDFDPGNDIVEYPGGVQ